MEGARFDTPPPMNSSSLSANGFYARRVRYWVDALGECSIHPYLKPYRFTGGYVNGLPPELVHFSHAPS